MERQYADDIVETLRDVGINFAAGLPDSWLVDIIREVEQDEDFTYVPVCNEGVGFSACVGAWLGGKRPVLLMENSGLRTAAESIARLHLDTGGGGGHHGVNVLIVASYRGDIGETEFWAQNHGITCENLLETFRIPYLVVRDEDDLGWSIEQAARTAFKQVTPAAVLVSNSVTQEA